MKPTLKYGLTQRFVVAWEKFNMRVLEKAKAAGVV
jgi:hypothetical protein